MKTVLNGNALSRRSILFGLAAAPAAGVALGAIEHCSGVEQGSALDRLQHHLLMAAAAADDLIAARPDSRWVMTARRKKGEFSYQVDRFDLISETINGIPGGLKWERATTVLAGKPSNG
ncbi:hypothetical protein [Mesorhizobium sp. M2A.F.Ca.ET.067.02.1.1]|uniref:hypothetical protein n=1 Tax=Mesorhizobium sp. M2A.F.Ca.ET.067.02.1.1 TaxID=2496749 RepID=UPI000FD1E28D|nr:hypothetical protein [Mesorhizobium sp. M2A.F.Ca.ET.067.02.1.1]RUW81496.1 hypothetical protein EOA28_00785 [Mesorhizobium sp. M2A.F.Ca.ET.067.02.1.1]TIU58002.1 MAG: hypothetical protein E5W35_06500 [Mesorhizobium sp.]